MLTKECGTDVLVSVLYYTCISYSCNETFSAEILWMAINPLTPSTLVNAQSNSPFILSTTLVLEFLKARAVFLWQTRI